MTAPAVETATAPAEQPAATVEADLSGFQDAVLNVIADPTNVDPADVEKARAEYLKLDRKGKAAARAHVSEGSQTAVFNGNLPEAQALMRLNQELVVPTQTKGKTGGAKPKDPTEAFALEQATAQLAYSLTVLNKPEAVDDEALAAKLGELVTEDVQALADQYRTWVSNGSKGDEPELPEYAKAAARISLGRSPKGQGRKPAAKKEEATAAPADETATVPATAPVTTEAPITDATVAAYDSAVGN